MTNACFLSRRLEFDFPLTTTHHGIPLSNGTFGALIWGDVASRFDHVGSYVYSGHIAAAALKVLKPRS